MKVYPVHEPELNTISLMNTGTTVFVGIGSFSLQSIIGEIPIAWKSLLLPNVTATILCFFAGIFCLCQKNKTIKSIKDGYDESKTS